MNIHNRQLTIEITLDSYRNVKNEKLIYNDIGIIEQKLR